MKTNKTEEEKKQKGIEKLLNSLHTLSSENLHSILDKEFKKQLNTLIEKSMQEQCSL